MYVADKTGLALGPRLSVLASLAARHEMPVWDIGADHGHLAAAIQAADPARKVHAVDRVPALCTAIASRYPTLTVHCTDAQALDIPSDAGGSLVILAGLGGDTVADLVDALLARHVNGQLHFLLCPVRQCWPLRERLSTLPLVLNAEQLVSERGRVYEILSLAPCAVPAPEQRPWPVGLSRLASGPLRSAYLAERRYVHRFKPAIATAYDALLTENNRENVNALVDDSFHFDERGGVRQLSESAPERSRAR